MVENHAVFAETVSGEFFPDDDVTVSPSMAGGLARVAEEETFDAVLVDFDLDDGLGTDLVQRMRAEGYQGLMVAVSAKEEGNKVLVREGADVACNKLEFGSLRGLLDSLLRRVEIEAPNLARAASALDGLSVGDAFGECFFGPDDWAQELIRSRRLPPSPWVYTDDTEMATAITEVLAEYRHVDPAALARAFARRFVADPNRGYGAGACRLLQQLRDGVPWREASHALFDGQGSMGNGGAMRAGPIGAYFAEDLLLVIREARASAAITHAHLEGQAGAVAVAAAAAYACRKQFCPSTVESSRLLNFVLPVCPPGPTRDGLVEAARLPAATTVSEAASILGNGSRLLSSDTVPFALWCAEKHLGDYQAALWTTVEGLGDRDTTCAMVGGIVAPTSPPPAHWLRARESLRFEKDVLPDSYRSVLRDRAQAWLWSLRAGRLKE